jgi:hypothetical protein
MFTETFIHHISTYKYGKYHVSNPHIYHVFVLLQHHSLHMFSPPRCNSLRLVTSRAPVERHGGPGGVVKRPQLDGFLIYFNTYL